MLKLIWRYKHGDINMDEFSKVFTLNNLIEKHQK